MGGSAGATTGDSPSSGTTTTLSSPSDPPPPPPTDPAQATNVVPIGQTRTFTQWGLEVSNSSGSARDILVNVSDAVVTVSPAESGGTGAGPLGPGPQAPANPGNFSFNVTGTGTNRPVVTWSGTAYDLSVGTNGEVKGAAAGHDLTALAPRVTGTLTAAAGQAQIGPWFGSGGGLAGGVEETLVDATVHAQKGVTVGADTVRGSFTSDDDMVSLTATHTVRLAEAAVSAKTGVSVKSVQGGVEGGLDVANGPALVEGREGVQLTVAGAQQLTAKSETDEVRIRSSAPLVKANLELQAGTKVDVDAEGSARVAATAPGDVTVHLTGDLEIREVRSDAGDVDVRANDIRRPRLEDPNSPGQLIPFAGQVWAGKGLVIDAGAGVEVETATAGTNLWVAARSGTADGSFMAPAGWAYVWASDQVRGNVSAQQEASVTALTLLDAAVSSLDGDVEVFSGGDVLRRVTAAKDLTVDAVGSVKGELRGDADVDVTAGGDVTKEITAGGGADVAVGGNLSAPSVTAATWLDVVVTGDVARDDEAIFPMLSAGEEATVWAGGKVTYTVSGAATDVTAGGPVSGNVRASAGAATVWTGGSLTGNVTAAKDVMVEAVAGVNSRMSGGFGVTAVSDGDIAGSAEADWVVDLRSATSSENATVSTRMGQAAWVSSPASPRNVRLAQLRQEIADQQQTLSALGGNNDAYQIAAQRMAELEGERTLLEDPPRLDSAMSKIPAARVKSLLDSGDAQTFDDTYEGSSLKGYVVLSDVVGGQAYTVVLEPFYTTQSTNTTYPVINAPTTPVEGSLAGSASWRSMVEYFREVRRTTHYSSGTSDLAALVSRLRTPEVAIGYAQAAVLSRQAEQIELLKAGIEVGVTLVPFVGTADHLAKGEYWEAGFSFVGDVAMLTGVGAGVSAAIKGRKCMVAGQKVLRMARVAQVASAVDGGLGVARLGQGFYAPGKGDTAAAWGYFGDATLRLFGLAGASKYLKTKPKCFVAGTVVHTEAGPRRIEDVRAGDLVWGYDRLTQQWRLCPVMQTFENVADGRLATVVFADGDRVTGTDGHPVWVIEGGMLAARPTPEHGSDEPAGPTPGRWVALGDLVEGDVVLARDGRVRRVAGVHFADGPATVYNLEVAGVHAYAVGAGGVLAHNSGADDYACLMLARQATAKEVTKAAEKPAVKAPAAKVGTAAERGSAKGAAAPKNKTTAPTTEAVKSRSYRDRPRSNGDPRVKYKSEAAGPVQRTKLKPEDLKALEAELTAYKGPWSEAEKQAKNEAGETLGQKGADRYMTSEVGATQRYTQQSANGNFDLDAVYQKGDRLIVVEAKSPSGKLTARQVEGETIADGRQAFAMEGSQQYLQDTALVMSQNTDNQLVSDIGRDILTALRDKKVDYLQVSTRPRTDGSAFFSVKTFKID